MGSLRGDPTCRTAQCFPQRRLIFFRLPAESDRGSRHHSLHPGNPDISGRIFDRRQKHIARKQQGGGAHGISQGLDSIHGFIPFSRFGPRFLRPAVAGPKWLTLLGLCDISTA